MPNQQKDGPQVQLGFVHSFIPPVIPDPLNKAFGPILELQKLDLGASQYGNTSSFSPSPMAIRCWAKYFSDLDRSHPTINIPSQWVDFFTLMMLKQGSYEWAKEFLNSQAWPLFQQHFGNETYYSFSLPSNKPSVVITDISCPSSASLSDAAAATSTNQGFPKVSSGAENQVDLVDDQSTPPPPSAICITPPKGKRGKRHQSLKLI